MNSVITVEEAQAKLKELIRQLAPGDEVVITENQLPIAKLIGEPKRPQTAQPRAPGLGKDMISFIAPDFDAPLDDMQDYME